MPFYMWCKCKCKCKVMYLLILRKININNISTWLTHQNTKNII